MWKDERMLCRAQTEILIQILEMGESHFFFSIVSEN